MPQVLEHVCKALFWLKTCFAIGYPPKLLVAYAIFSLNHFPLFLACNNGKKVEFKYKLTYWFHMFPHFLLKNRFILLTFLLKPNSYLHLYLILSFFSLFWVNSVMHHFKFIARRDITWRIQHSEWWVFCCCYSLLLMEETEYSAYDSWWLVPSGP